MLKTLNENNEFYLPFNRLNQFIKLNGGVPLDINLLIDGPAVFYPSEFDYTDDDFVNEYPNDWLWAKKFYESHNLGISGKKLIIFDLR